MLSTKADALPIIAITHIQKTEPNPPKHKAVDTPTMFPVPTREAVETIRAWNEETPDPSLGFSVTALNCSLSMLN